MKWSEIACSPVLATAPTVEPLSYADAKTWLRLDNDNEEQLIVQLIADARQKVEQDTGRKLITQAWDVFFDAFPDDAIYLPVEPLLSVTTLKVTSVAGLQSTVTSTIYQVDTAGSPPRIWLADGQSWPSDIRLHLGIVARVSVGFGPSGASVPGLLINAMRQLLTIWYSLARPGSAGIVLLPKQEGYAATIQSYHMGGMA